MKEPYLTDDLETSRLYLKYATALSMQGICSYPATAIALWYELYEEYIKKQLSQATRYTTKIYGKLDIGQVRNIKVLRSDITETKRPAATHQSGARHRFWKIHLPLINPYCDICGNPLRLTMHHNHYRKWGHEGLSDVSLLRKRCHGLVHTWSFPYNELYLPHEKSEKRRKLYGNAEIL